MSSSRPDYGIFMSPLGDTSLLTQHCLDSTKWSILLHWIIQIKFYVCSFNFILSLSIKSLCIWSKLTWSCRYIHVLHFKHSILRTKKQSGLIYEFFLGKKSNSESCIGCRMLLKKVWSFWICHVMIVVFRNTCNGKTSCWWF